MKQSQVAFSNPPEHKNPLFVLGMWRSGTSLLYAMLNQHPDIKLLYESELPLLWPLFLSPARRSWAERIDFWNGVLRRHRIDRQMLPATADLATAFESMARLYAESRGARIWGCKSPNYYNMVPRLAREFPNARYIFLWRDPKEICASVVRAACNSFWFRRRGMLRRVLFGCEMLRRACERLRDSGRPVHELYYGDLVEDPERELQQICSFLGIPFVSAMTSLEGADLSAVFDGDHHNILKNSGEVRRHSNPKGQNISHALDRKIERYNGLWHSRFPNWRLACRQQIPIGPGPWEQCVDRLIFSALCAADQSRRWLFAFLPLNCWRTYRRLRYQNEDRYIQSTAMTEGIVGRRSALPVSPPRVSKPRVSSEVPTHNHVLGEHMNRKKRILVTGAGGFIGHHLVKQLKADGHWVRGVDIKSPEYEASDADEFDRLDLRRFDNALLATRGGVHEVYNLAADMGGIGYITSFHADIARNNTLINVNMLEASRQNCIGRFLFSSSACVYAQGKQQDADVTPLREEDAYPADPEPGYGWEKLFAEQMCKYYSGDYGVSTRVVRFHNVYGPLGTYDGGKEKAPAAICRKVALASDRGEIEVWGDGLQTRSFMYVSDCVEGLIRLMASEFSEPLNLGTDELVSIDGLVDMVCGIAGKKLTKVHNVKGPQGVRGRNSDNTLLRKVLGWEPGIMLNQGLVVTYRWIEGDLKSQENGITAHTSSGSAVAA